jgi:hypothetical protein
LCEKKGVRVCEVAHGTTQSFVLFVWFEVVCSVVCGASYVLWRTEARKDFLFAPRNYGCALLDLHRSIGTILFYLEVCGAALA